jgi:hypothetical protein
LAEIRRVLKPGARFSALVWGMGPNNPYLFTQSERVRAHREAAGLPVRPSASYRLAEPGALAGALQSGGFTDVSVRAVPHRRRFASATAAAQNVFEEFPAQRAIAAELPEEHVRAVLAEIAAAYERYAVADGVDLPGEVLVAVGTR